MAGVTTEVRGGASVPTLMGGELEKTRLLRILGQLRNERSSHEPTWRDIGQYISPRRIRFFAGDQNRGERRDTSIIDNTAGIAEEVLKAGMQGGITNPARKWFRLGAPKPELNDEPGVREYMHEVEEILNSIISRSNFYDTIPIVYGDGATFSTGVMFVQEDFQKVFHCSEYPVGSYYIGNNRKREVRLFAREFQMNIRQVVEEFGWDQGEARTDENIHWERFTDYVHQNWDSHQRELWVNVCHLIEENRRFDTRRAEAEFKRYASWHFETTTGAGTNASSPNAQNQMVNDIFLRKSGFDEFPVLVFRWETAGEDIYGTNGPGIKSIGDVKQLQRGEKKSLKAIDKMVDPPMVAPPEARGTRLSILPAEVSYVGDRKGGGGFRAAHEVSFRVDQLEIKQQAVRLRIREHYKTPLFNLFAELERKSITVGEILQRQAERVVQLGPTLTRFNLKFLDPFIDIVFNYATRQGLLPEPPEVIRGAGPFRVEFVSVLALAQKLSAFQSIENYLAFVSQLGQIKPEAFDVIDVDGTLREVAEIFGVPPDVLFTTDQVTQMREVRAQAQAQAAAAERAQASASAAKDLAGASLEGDNALGRLLQLSEAGSLAPSP